MKKIIILTLFGLILSANSSYAVGGNLLQAREARIASRAAVITQIQANVSQDLRSRAEKEITRRVDFLTQLIAQINGVKKLSLAEKASLQSQIQAQIDGLNALQTKINADTDNATLKTDVKSIINNYYIFLFFRVQVNLLVATDRTSTTIDTFSQIYTKLQTRINQAQAAGDNVSQLNISLADMKAKINDASIQTAVAQAELTPLNAQGYPGNKPSLQDARTKIQAAVQDLKVAYSDAVSIRQGLKGLGITNPGASTSAH
ncbi:MAG: hypothetical protein ABSE17_02355 [Candidatus Levyibacteriota bacterium]|jgi:DNA mismatch repair ATPase MutS